MSGGAGGGGSRRVLALEMLRRVLAGLALEVLRALAGLALGGVAPPLCLRE